MGQLQKVSWRTVGYAALGTGVAAASVIAVFNSDGVHPTALTSSSATKWLVDNVNGTVVLVDGLAGNVVAKVQLESETDNGDIEVAVQGAGGAFLVVRNKHRSAPSRPRSCSSAPRSRRSAQREKREVGRRAQRLDDPQPGNARGQSRSGRRRPDHRGDHPVRQRQRGVRREHLALHHNTATHVTVDKPNEVETLRNPPKHTTTLGGKAVMFDEFNGVIEWSNGDRVSVDTIPNFSEAILQEPGDDASCVWLAIGDNLYCVGHDGIDETEHIAGLSFSSGGLDKLAVWGRRQPSFAATTASSASISRTRRWPPTRSVRRSTLRQAQHHRDSGLIWIDNTRRVCMGREPTGHQRHRQEQQGRARRTTRKGQPTGDAAGGSGGDSTAGSSTAADQSDEDKLDHNNQEDPPKAIDDSVTAARVPPSPSR